MSADRLGRITVAPPSLAFDGCDAFAAPGRLLINLTSPLHTQWRPLNERVCPPLPDYLPALWQLSHGPHPLPANTPASYSEEFQLTQADLKPPTEYPPLDNSTLPVDPIGFLRDRRATRGPVPTILVLGDSVDRNGLVHFCQLMRRNVSISHYHDITLHPRKALPPDLTRGHGPKFDGWDQRGLPHLCEIPFYAEALDRSGEKIAMRVVNGFHYGMDALDEFDTPDHGDWHKPGRIEVRIDELVLPMLDQMGGVDAVDLILLHSGMWDIVSEYLTLDELTLAGTLWDAGR